MIIFHSAVRHRDDNDPITIQKHLMVWKLISPLSPLLSRTSMRCQTFVWSRFPLTIQWGGLSSSNPKKTDDVPNLVLSGRSSNWKIKLLVKLAEEDQDEIWVYNEIIDIFADQYDEVLQDTSRKWMFKGITAHKGLLSTKHPHYNG